MFVGGSNRHHEHLLAADLMSTRIANPRLGETSAQGPREVDDRIGRYAAAGTAICHFVDEARDRALLRQ